MTSTKLYCVYLTTYAGNKMPMFYIGYSSVDNIQNGYHGSVSSNAYRDIWKQELRENPHLFKTQIVCVFDTRLEAEQKESELQRKLKVVKSSMYINMTDGFSASWCAKYPGQEHYLRGRKRVVDTRSGNIVYLKPKDIKPYHIPDTSRNNTVSVIDMTTGHGRVVHIDEFNSSPELVGPNTGRCTVYVIATGKTIQIDVADYDKSIYMHTTSNKVCVFDLVDNRPRHVTKEEYHSNKERYQHSSSNKKVVYDFETEEFVSIPKEDAANDPGRYICPTKFYRKYQNVVTGEVIKIPMIDSDEIAMIESSGTYEVYAVSPNKGKVWYKNILTGESSAMVEGTQPDGWVLGRHYHRSADIVWFCNPERTEETYCSEEFAPEGWMRGRSTKPNAKKRAKDKMRWVHNPETKERTMIQKDDPNPDG